MELRLLSQGAEARIYEGTLLGRPCIVKERFAKTCVAVRAPRFRLMGVSGRYRHAELDRQLRRQQLANELRSVLKCSRVGIRVGPWRGCGRPRR